jgi:hypothetical protein
VPGVTYRKAEGAAFLRLQQAKAPESYIHNCQFYRNTFAPFAPPMGDHAPAINPYGLFGLTAL